MGRGKVEAVADETKGLPEAHRLGELQDWEKERLIKGQEPKIGRKTA